MLLPLKNLCSIEGGKKGCLLPFPDSESFPIMIAFLFAKENKM